MVNSCLIIASLGSPSRLATVRLAVTVFALAKVTSLSIRGCSSFALARVVVILPSRIRETERPRSRAERCPLVYLVFGFI